MRVHGNLRAFSAPRTLIVANHESFLDGLLLGLFLPVNPVFVVHSYVARHWFFRLILSQVDYLAVDPTSPMAMKQVIRLVENGRPVAIFPEGRITVTGSLMKVYDGPAFVAARTCASIVPVRLDGTARSLFARVSGKAPRRWFPRISLHVLPTTRIPMPTADTPKERRRLAGEAMRRLMQDMLFASRPRQTLYAALCDAMETHGRKHRLLEDIKQVEYNYGDLLKMALMLARLVERAAPEVAPDDRIGVLLPLLSGAGVFLYPSPLHYRIIPELAYDRGCTVLFGTSTFLANYGKFAHPYDFFRLRYVIAGAEKVADPVRQLWFEKFGLRILEGYGATETAPVLAVNTPMAYRTGSVGQFLPGLETRLLPVPGIERGGMLHVRGPNLMAGYLRVEAPGVLQAPRSSLGGGWYETGDIVEVDEAGFVRIVGRVKRFAKVAGEMVSLESVEKLAAAASPERQHAASRRAAGAAFPRAGLRSGHHFRHSARVTAIPPPGLPAVRAARRHRQRGVSANGADPKRLPGARLDAACARRRGNELTPRAGTNAPLGGARRRRYAAARLSGRAPEPLSRRAQLVAGVPDGRLAR